jgi:hypothetical protein
LPQFSIFGKVHRQEADRTGWQETGVVLADEDGSMSPDSNSAATLIAAVLLAAAAAVTFHLSPQVPLGVPWDEPGKVSQILCNDNDFYHPILMLQSVRIANVWVAASDPASVLKLGRTMAALSGGLLVFAAIALTRRAMGNFAALGAGVLTAVAPLTVLHSPGSAVRNRGRVSRKAEPSRQWLHCIPLRRQFSLRSILGTVRRRRPAALSSPRPRARCHISKRQDGQRSCPFSNI